MVRDERCGGFGGYCLFRGDFGLRTVVALSAWVRYELRLRGDEELAPAGVGGEAGCCDARRDGGRDAVYWIYVGLSGDEGLTTACVGG